MRILVATDQPFWKCRGGAHQRIGCLLEGLAAQGQVQVETFFLGDPDDLPVPKVAALSVPGRIHCPRSPGRLRAFRASLSNWFGRRSVAPGENEHIAPELTLADYRWPWVFPHFQRAVDGFQPDVILLEYVTMAYLREAIDDPAGKILWAMDTHDCLAQRCEQFRQLGQSHWLSISEEEEVAAWQQADLLIAIQAREADWMREKLPDQQVVVAGHFDSRWQSLRQDAPVRDDAPVRFGFLASQNFPNQMGLDFLLQQVWPELEARTKATLVLGGSICRGLDLTGFHRVQGLGYIEDPGEFYRQVDVVVNPVTIGTGLKIKSVEALGWGKPLVATTHSAVQDNDGRAVTTGVIVCDTPSAWQEEMRNLATDPNYVSRVQQASLQASFSVSQAYQACYQILSEHRKKKSR